MNILIFEKDQLKRDTLLRIEGRKFEHIKNVLKLHLGDRIKIGELNGNIGIGEINTFYPSSVDIEIVELNSEPPTTLPVTLVLALPRPQMIKRILQTIATMGVESVFLIHTERVEKSFWQSPSCTPEAMQEQLVLGLEQGMATQLPTIETRRKIWQFAEMDLPNMSRTSECYIAHPGSLALETVSASDKRYTLAIGPEGGFVEKEVAQFTQSGFTPIRLGERILKVETAVPVLLSKFFY